MPCMWDFTVPGVTTLQKGVEMAIVTPQVIPSTCEWLGCLQYYLKGGRRSPAVACWASDHWVASSNPLTGKFHN